MESSINASARTPEEYVLGPPGFRSDGIATTKCHPLVTYKDYLSFVRSKGLNVIPELKDTGVPAVEKFLTEELRKDIYWLADQFATAILEAGYTGAKTEDEWARIPVAVMQTFDHRIAKHWKTTEVSEDIQVEYMWITAPPLNATVCPSPSDCGTEPVLRELASLGVEFFGPPLQLLLSSVDPSSSLSSHRLFASETAQIYSNLIKTHAKRNVGTNLFPSLTSWSLERSGCPTLSHTAQIEPSRIGPCGNYYGPVEGQSVFTEVDIPLVIDVLFRDVGISGLFADFPASVSTYVNCVLDG